MEEKKCTKCGEWFPYDRDHFHSVGRGKLAARCKKCKNEDNAKYGRNHYESKRRHNKKYADDNLSHTMVEGDGFKKITVPCFGCGRDLKILWDTTSDRRKPKMMCYKCKNPSGYQPHEPDYTSEDKPSELPLMDH